jgi:hypothetical protein
LRPSQFSLGKRNPFQPLNAPFQHLSNYYSYRVSSIGIAKLSIGLYSAEDSPSHMVYGSTIPKLVLKTHSEHILVDLKTGQRNPGLFNGVNELRDFCL